MFDGLLLDGGTLCIDLLIAAEVGVGGRHIAEALVIALVIILRDECLDLTYGPAFPDRFAAKSGSNPMSSCREFARHVMGDMPRMT
ncbi:hypothetical protein FHW92_002486 [Novosphingobium sp. SG707]|nr:hypothetical protein [Novosphingobium sp. SG707]